MPRKFDLGRLVLLGAGLLLFLSLFLDWYRLGGHGVSAWTSFEIVDLVLAVVAATAVAAALVPDALPERLPAGLAAAAILVVVVQLADPPPAVTHAAHLATGAWLALAAALLMGAAAALTFAAFSVVVQVRDRDRRARMAAVDARERSAGPVAAAGSAAAAGPVAEPGSGADPDATQPLGAPSADEPGATAAP